MGSETLAEIQLFIDLRVQEGAEGLAKLRSSHSWVKIHARKLFRQRNIQIYTSIISLSVVNQINKLNGCLW